MNIKEFFEQSAGKWFSQRTSHLLAVQQSENGTSTVMIEMLSADAPEVVKLCQQYGIKPQLAICGAKVTWDGTIEWNKQKENQKGSTLLVPVLEADKPNEGRLLRERGNAEKPPVASRYIIGSDDALTLITDYETMCSEERLWFAGPNLRMHTSVLRRFDGFSVASLATEIRMGVTQPPKKAEDAANV